MADTPTGASPQQTQQTQQPPAEALRQAREPQRAGALEALKAIRAAGGAAPVAAVAPVVAVAPEVETPAVETPAAVADDAAPAPTVDTPAANDVHASIRKQEIHLRKQIATERANMEAEFAQRMAALQPKIDQTSKLEQAIANARQDPLHAIKTILGFSDADMAPLSQLIYSASPEGQKDPRYAKLGREALEKNGQLTQIEKLQKQFDELNKSIEQKQNEAVLQQQLDRYAGTIVKAIDAKTSPLASSAMTKNPERARAQMMAVADRLYMESGPSHDTRDLPTPAEVLKAYEAERRQELEELGIDVSLIGKAAPAPTAAKKIPTTLAPAEAPAPAIEAPVVAVKSNPTARPQGQKPTREEALLELRKMREQGIG